MKTYFFMQKRWVGKTTIAIYEYIKSPETTLFVSVNNAMSTHIKVILTQMGISFNEDNILTANELLYKLRGRININRIILDEYMFFDSKNMMDIYYSIKIMDIDELLIYSTANKPYDTYVFNFIKENKTLLTIERIREILSEELNCNKKLLNEMISELYYNFITEPDTTLITTPIMKPNWNRNKNWENDLLILCGLETYNLEVKNKFLKNILSEVD